MKKVISILLLLLAFKQGFTQARGIPDTLSYLQSIINSKSAYIGKPFSSLLDSLRIQIKFFSPYPGNRNNINIETATSFGWSSVEVPEDIALAYPLLEVSWEPNTSIEESLKLYSSERWCHKVQAHYSARIVSDIRIRE